MTSTSTAVRDAGGPSRTTPMRILVIEEESLMRTILARYLPRIGYDAVAVRSCREACALMDGEPWDAVVMSLPLARGSSEKRFVIFREPEGSSPPPMPRVLTTPFHLEDLGEALQRVGARAHSRDRRAAIA